MKDIQIYIKEGFLDNIGANKYVDLITHFGDELTKYSELKEVEKKRWKTSMPETKIYKKLYNLFNETPSFEATYDCVFNVSIDGNIFKTDVCIQRFTFIKKNNSFKYHVEYLHERYPEENHINDEECKDFTDFLSNFVLYLNNARRYDLLRKSAKFIVK